jgi:hypothetical protein
VVRAGRRLWRRGHIDGNWDRPQTSELAARGNL